MIIIKLLIRYGVAVLSTVGFGLISNIPRRAIPAAAITGATSWLVYFLLQGDGTTIVLANFFAAVTIGVMGNFLAQKISVPVNTIYIPSLISIVPGSIVYLGMKNITTGKGNMGSDEILKVLEISMSLAVGFVCAEVIYSSVNRVLNKIN